MKRLGLWLAAGLVAFLAVALLFDLFVGVVQPEFEPDGRSLVLITTDAEGQRHETRLAVVEDAEGNAWVQSGHHFRGWYHRAVANPQVEVVRLGETKPYTAVPIDTPESEALIEELFIQRGGALRHFVIRALLLFADVKPVRLDPRQEPG
ncbi:MAG: hypothetical protein ACQGVC_07490 [Myxococcota bacterium]